MVETLMTPGHLLKRQTLRKGRDPKDAKICVHCLHMVWGSHFCPVKRENIELPNSADLTGVDVTPPGPRKDEPHA